MKPLPKLRQSTLKLQCSACPTAWDVETADGRSAYIRYRYGSLSVNIRHESGIKTIWESQVGGEWDGAMTEREMREHLAGRVEFVP